MNIGNIFGIPPQKNQYLWSLTEIPPPPDFRDFSPSIFFMNSFPTPQRQRIFFRCHIHGPIVQNKSFVPCNWSQHLGAGLVEVRPGMVFCWLFFNLPGRLRMKSLANVLKVYEDDILSIPVIYLIYMYIFIYQTSFRTFNHLFEHGNTAFLYRISTSSSVEERIVAALKFAGLDLNNCGVEWRILCDSCDGFVSRCILKWFQEVAHPKSYTANPIGSIRLVYLPTNLP